MRLWLCLVSNVLSDPFTVDVKVRSGWPHVAPESEELEFLRELDTAEALSYLRTRKEPELHPAVRTFVDLLKANHYYSPRVEFDRALERMQRRNYSVNCLPWALWGSKRLCSPDELSEGPGTRETTPSTRLKRAEDVVVQDGPEPTLVLYGQVGSSLDPWFNAKVNARIIFRHADNFVDSDILSGYAAELAIKSSEYKATADDSDGKEEADTDVKTEDHPLDGFYFNTLTRRYPEMKEELAGFKEERLAAQDEDALLEAWELRDLGLQTVRTIKEASDPLSAMENVTQDFPIHVRGLSKLGVPKELKNALAKLKATLGDTEFFAINGRRAHDMTDPAGLFTLLKQLLPDFLAVERKRRLGVPVRMLKPSPPLDDGAQSKQMRLDWRHSALPSPLFDVLTEKKCKSWTKNLQALLHGGSRGGVAAVKYALYNIVVVIDPSDPSDIDELRPFLVNPTPSKIHFVFASSSTTTQEQSMWDIEQLGQIPKEVAPFVTAIDNAGTGRPETPLVDLIADTFAAVLGSGSTKEKARALSLVQELHLLTSKEKLENQFFRVMGATKSKVKLWEEIIQGEWTKRGSAAAREYTRALGLPVPCIILNGRILKKAAFSNLVQHFMREQHRFQEAVYRGILHSAKVEDYSFALGTSPVTQYHPDITPTLAIEGGDSSSADVASHSYRIPASGIFLALPFFTGPPDATSSAFHISYVPSLRQASILRAFATHMLDAYASKNGGTSPSWVPIIPTGRNPELDALGACVRGALTLKKPADLDERQYRRQQLLFLKYIGTALDSLDSPNTKAIGALCTNGAQKKLRDTQFTARVKETEAESAISDWLGQRLDSDDPQVVWWCNGRTITLSHGASKIQSEIIATLEQAELNNEPDFSDNNEKPIASPILALVRAIENQAEHVIKGSPPRIAKHFFEHVSPELTLHLQSKAPSPLTIYGILNPLSDGAAAASTLLRLFHELFDADITVVFNPPTRLSEYPLKKYVRQVAARPGTVPVVHFQLTTRHTLTLTLHVLPTWLATATKADTDLDNIKQVNTSAEYTLNELYLEGQAFGVNKDGYITGSIQGVQVDMFKGKTFCGDTFVMQNLGYFQLVANPGMYTLKLKGASAETYDIVSGPNVAISSFFTVPMQLRVRLKEGKSPYDVHINAGTSSGASDNPITSLLDIFGERHLPKVHIFSVASGHLYEKLLSIMCLSVRRHTKAPLHFWFISNFLSPAFTDFIPRLAKEHNFDYNMVTYKWPSWLNPQSEKQRLIWAYKILFLDVLFPMDVPKVIFIDADQVVRADVLELWNMDLEGAVYGFTPMCNTNPLTTNFRFWDTGYWANHLGPNKKYHISALFVVDLIKFRAEQAGDMLRQVYNSLTQDPNSLANLDQDLPNFAQHQLPIFSLPQDWLWCETWCSQESKATAKTIDLCQNPLTKEPKIKMATRIISEWQEIHDQVKALDDLAGKRKDKRDEL